MAWWGTAAAAAAAAAASACDVDADSTPLSDPLLYTPPTHHPTASPIISPLPPRPARTDARSFWFLKRLKACTGKKQKTKTQIIVFSQLNSQNNE